MCCCGRGMATDSTDADTETEGLGLKTLCNINRLKHQLGFAQDSCRCEAFVPFNAWGLILNSVALLYLIVFLTLDHATLDKIEPYAGPIHAVLGGGSLNTTIGEHTEENTPILHTDHKIFSVEIGSVARALHVVAVGGCLVSLFIWCWLGLLRRYTDENKIIKVVNAAFNTATQMCIVVCAIVWCVGLDDGTPQAAWPPLLLWHTALCFFGSFVFAWCLLVIPNKVLQFPPKGAATERIQKV